MLRRHLLYLSAQELSARPLAGGRLGGATAFPATAAGQEAFCDYLRQYPGERCHLLVNVAEEGFQVESIPGLRGRERAAVIQRKLQQRFYGTDLCLARSLGFTRARRKDERLLLAGLTHPAQIAPWTALMQSLDVPLAGIHSLPLVSIRLFRKLHPGAEPCLLLTIQDHSLRQSFFDRGELLFSRLTALGNGGTADLGRSMAAEAARMYQFLGSQGLLPRGQVLQALVLAHPRSLATLEQAWEDSGKVLFRGIGNDAAARLAGCNRRHDQPADDRSDTLFLQLLASHPPAQQFAPPALRHAYRLWQWRALLSGAGPAFLLACLLGTGLLLHDAHRTATAVAAARAQAEAAARHHAELAHGLPALPVDHDTLARLLERYRELSGGATTPRDFYVQLSRALDVSPGLALETISWQRAGPGDANVPGSGEEQAIVRGAVTGAAGHSPRRAQAAFSIFLAALERQPELQATVQQQPADMAPGKPPSSARANGPPGAIGALPFVLHIARRGSP